MRLDCFVHDSEMMIGHCFNAGEVAQPHASDPLCIRGAVLMAPFVAIVRLLVTSVYAGATIALIYAVAAITFALLMTVLHVGAIARPIG